jgi:Family of unknown function (DUF6011)
MTTILHIPPIAKLAELREVVLAHSEKRKPKWGFRLAPDIVMELQAQPCSLLSEHAKARGCKQAVVKFEGQAVMVEGASHADFKRRLIDIRLSISGVRMRMFALVQFAGEPDWRLELRSSVRARGDDPRHLERLDAAILAALQGDGIFTKLTPELMLKPSCMLCGKGLTDPASMARWIGPECAATSSIRIFFEQQVEAA